MTATQLTKNQMDSLYRFQNVGDEDNGAPVAPFVTILDVQSDFAGGKRVKARIDGQTVMFTIRAQPEW